MARSRRDFSIPARSGAKLRDSTPTDPHHDVLGRTLRVATALPAALTQVSNHGFAVVLHFDELRPEIRQNLAVSAASNELSTTQPLWRVPLTRILAGRTDRGGKLPGHPLTLASNITGLIAIPEG